VLSAYLAARAGGCALFDLLFLNSIVRAHAPRAHRALTVAHARIGVHALLMFSSNDYATRTSLDTFITHLARERCARDGRAGERLRRL
jgi:hypothetical protein